MKMTKAPVYYALAQAQFNPVVAIAKYVDGIQDILRLEGYTLFEPQEITQLQFVGVAGQAATQPELMRVTNWLISKADRTAGFILSASSLTYHTTHYETRNEFLPELVQGLQAVHKVVSLAHIARLGLRYLDAVIPGDGEEVSQYLVDGLRGVSFGAKPRYAMTESVYETETGPLVKSGTLVARVYRSISALGYPPDLIPHGLLPMPRFQRTDAISHAVIDTDHFVQGTMPINLEQIKVQLASLHTGIKQSFEATITPYAEKAWR
jgi:uncharacterized protein (TIGR04255 family)